MERGCASHLRSKCLGIFRRILTSDFIFMHSWSSPVSVHSKNHDLYASPFFNFSSISKYVNQKVHLCCFWPPNTRVSLLGSWSTDRGWSRSLFEKADRGWWNLRIDLMTSYDLEIIKTQEYRPWSQNCSNLHPPKEDSTSPLSTV